MSDYKHKGTISITHPSGGMWLNDDISISIRDESSRTGFLDIKISAKALMLALTGRGDSPMSFSTNKLDRVGLYVIRKTLNIEVPKDIPWGHRNEKCYELALKECEGTGWIPSDYFGSKSSFFTSGTVEFARVGLSKYVTKEEYEKYQDEQAEEA